MKRITDWLRSESLPRSLYEMLGHPLLDPDREALLQSIRKANRDLLDYQSHPEPAVAKRAMLLLTELGRCRGILEDEARHTVYVEEVARSVRDQFVSERGPQALHSGNDLAEWLTSRHAVPAEAAERVVKLVRGDTLPPQPLPKRPPAKSGVVAPPAPKTEPIVEGVEIFELEDRPSPQRTIRDEFTDREPVPRRRQLKTGLKVPIAIAFGVVAISAVVAVVIVLTRGGSEKAAKADPPAVQTPPPAPAPEVPKPEEKKVVPVPPVKKPDPPTPPVEPDPPTPPKKPDVPPKPVEPDPPPPTPDPKPVEPKKVDSEPKIEPKPAETRFDVNDGWSLPLDPKPAYRVKDVYLRVHSVEIKPLTDLDRKSDVSPPLLVILVEATNQGTTERRYRRLIDWQDVNDDFYQYCHLFDDTKKNDQIKRPRGWLTYDRKRIEGIPSWVDDGDANRVLAPKKQGVFIPIIYENPKVPSREFTLKINAIRIVEKRGSGEEYGWYNLQIREKHWKQ